MAGWNGNGTFSRLYSWVADAAAGIDISATRMDADTNEITTQGFNNCLTRDGQGSATADLPLNGFKFTAVGNSTAGNQYVAQNQLYPAGGSTIVAPAPYLGESRVTALPEALLPSLMPGWYVEDGQTRPRTDPLWQATGEVNAAYWAFGNGDGTTTYTLPDSRGRVQIGKDNMGGTPANRVTSGVSGLDGETLGTVGGDQHAQAVIITTTLSGAVTAASTATSTVADGGHSHTIPGENVAGAGSILMTGSTSPTQASTNPAVTGVTVATSVSTAITNTMAASSTGNLTGASQNVPPGIVKNVVIFCGA